MSTNSVVIYVGSLILAPVGSAIFEATDIYTVSTGLVVLVSVVAFPCVYWNSRFVDGPVKGCFAKPGAKAGVNGPTEEATSDADKGK